MIAIYIVLGIIFFYLMICFISFMITFYKVKISVITKGIQKAIKPYGDIIAKAQKYYEELPKKDIYIKSYDNLKLHGTFIEAKDAIGTLILFHGYKSSAKIDLIPSLEFYVSLKFNIILVDGRSVCLSEGQFTTFGLKEKYDVELWVDYAKDTYKLPVILGGISMGASTVLFSAPLVKDKVSFIIEDSAYICPYDQICLTTDKTMPGMGKVFTPGEEVLCKMFLNIELKESILEKYKDANVPIIFIHGESDNFVPFECGKKLYDNYNGPKEFLSSDKADHGLTYYLKTNEYQDVIKKFVEKYIK